VHGRRKRASLPSVIWYTVLFRQKNTGRPAWASLSSSSINFSVIVTGLGRTLNVGTKTGSGEKENDVVE